MMAQALHPSQHDLNLALLDAIVLDYLQQEELVEAIACSSSSGPHPQVLLSIRASIECGNIETAFKTIQGIIPSVLKDERLLLRLRQQQFVEFLRKGGRDAELKALAYARDAIVPVALDAYPEAYPEFKRLLLLLLHRPESPATPPELLTLWDQQQRVDLSEVVYHTTCQTVGVSLPHLSLLLRYLCHVCQSYPHDPEEGEQVKEELVGELLLPGIDKGPLTFELLSPRSIIEADVQALMRGTGATRQDAMDALRHSAGDRVVALKSLLNRRRLNTILLDTLAQEYASYRGLLQVQSGTGADEDVEHTEHEAMDDYMELDRGATPPPSLRPLAIDTSTSNGCTTAVGDGDVHVNGHGNIEDMSADVSIHHVRCASKSPPHKIARWLGRKHARASGGQPPTTQDTGQAAEAAPAEATAASAVTAAAAAAAIAAATTTATATTTAATATTTAATTIATAIATSTATATATDRTPTVGLASTAAAGPVQSQAGEQQGSQEHTKAPDTASVSSFVRQDSLLRKVQQMVQDEQWKGLIGLLEETSPGFFHDNPSLLFQLYQRLYLQHVADGDVLQALQLARSNLTPIASEHPELQPLLKSTMSALLPGQASSQSASIAAESALTQQIQSALSQRLGWRLPRLMRLLSTLLSVHKAWCRKQRCADVFADTLKLDELRIAASATGDRTGAAASAGQGSTGAAEAWVKLGGVSGSSEDDSDDETALNEAAILQVVEFTELPRHQAIQLLTQNRGNVEAAVLQYFG